MIDSARCRPPDELRRFLNQDLTEREEAGLVGHLDRCTGCRRQLEALAARPREWTELPDLLRPDPDDEAGCREDRPRTDSSSPPSDTQLDFLAPTDDPTMLGRLGTYEVMGVIGWGGMGLVIKARDRALNRHVAIKVLAPQLAANPLARRRFAREARAAAAVVHEHVIAVHAVSEFRGLPYLVMPYFPAQSLQHRLDTGQSLSLAEILRIGRQVAAGLAAAHNQGLVHRDIKPANILLEQGIERVVITDFGLARTADDAALTRSGVITGTPQYMAPEQTREDPIDHRADLFSLGSVMYAMCTGRPPYRAETALAVLRRISDESPRPIQEFAPETPGWLVEIIAKLHEKNPAHRFQAAEDVSELLQRWLAHVQNPLHVPPPVGSIHRGRNSQVRRMLIPLAGCFLVSLITVGLFSRHGTVSLATPESESPSGQLSVPPRPSAQTGKESMREAAPEFTGPAPAKILEKTTAPVQLGELPQVPLENQWLTVHHVKALVSRIKCTGVREDGTQYRPELIPHPLMRIDDPARGRTGTSRHDGTLWAWSESGRPVAVAEVWRWNGNSRRWGHALISTTPGRVMAEIGRRHRWRPDRPGLEFQKIGQAARPSAFREIRTEQMKELAAGFSGFEVYRGKRIDLELLRSPVYRYESERLDGGMFVLSHYNNPEAILFIEAASAPVTDAAKNPGVLSHWAYAVAPCSSHELHVTYRGQEVVTIPEASNFVGSPTDPFWVLYVEPSSLPSP